MAGHPSESKPDRRTERSALPPTVSRIRSHRARGTRSVGNGRRLRRAPNYFLGYLARRRYYMVIAAAVLVVVIALLVYSVTLPDYGKNLSLNLGADLIGTLVVLFVIAPFMGREWGSHETVLERFDHRGFIRQTG